LEPFCTARGGASMKWKTVWQVFKMLSIELPREFHF
jgi:hypothetical protein